MGDDAGPTGWQDSIELNGGGGIFPAQPGLIAGPLVKPPCDVKKPQAQTYTQHRMGRNREGGAQGVQPTRRNVAADSETGRHTHGP